MENVTCTNCGADNKTTAKYCNRCGHELPKPQVVTMDTRAQQATTETPDRKKKLIGTVVGVLTFFLAYYAVQQIFFKPPSFDKVMVQAASELNKTCPIMVDQYTRLDNAVALPDNSFQYNYTLVNITKAEVNLDTVKKYIEPGILNNVRTNPDLQTYREHKTTMIYYYKDKNGEFVHKFTVTPGMYQ